MSHPPSSINSGAPWPTLFTRPCPCFWAATCTCHSTCMQQLSPIAMPKFKMPKHLQMLLNDYYLFIASFNSCRNSTFSTRTTIRATQMYIQDQIQKEVIKVIPPPPPHPSRPCPTCHESLGESGTLLQGSNLAARKIAITRCTYRSRMRFYSDKF